MKAGAWLLTAIIGFVPALLAAETGKSRELTEVRSRIEQVGVDMKHLSAEKSLQHEALEKLEKQYDELVDALNDIKVQIRQQEESLRILHGKLAAIQKSILSQQRSLEGLVKSAYAIGNQAGLKGILNQRDPSLSGRMQVYYDYVGKARLQKLTAIQEDFKTLQQLETQKDTETRLLQVSLDKKQQETDALNVLKQQRKKLLAQLDSDYLSKRSQMQRLVSDEKKLTALVASLQKNNDNAGKESSPPVENGRNRPHKVQNEPEHPQVLQKTENDTFPKKTFDQMQGQLPWPVQGSIGEHFGSRRFETTWDGTVINAREGASIHAVAAGRVVYADWLRGYGLLVIVDHGKDYMSLYAFNQSLYKSVGEKVSAGEALASVGRSGGRAHAALYFGIRKNGRPVNPEHWCRKSAQE